MTNPKRTILLVLLFMVIGIAAVTTNVVISGSTNIANNPDDFLVYFSDVKVNGVQDLSLVRNEKQLVFNKEFSSVGQRVEITYDITNASKNYDASISIECTPSTDYLSIVNSYDSANNLSARQSKTGVLTITQSKSYTGTDLTQEISCTINATAVEITSQGSGTVVSPVERSYSVGSEIILGTEHFYILDSTEDDVTLLAKYNLHLGYYIDENNDIITQVSNPTYIQDSSAKGGLEGRDYPWIGSTQYASSTQKGTNYSDYTGSIAETYVNGYREYLENSDIDIIEARLITKDEILGFGCEAGYTSSYYDCSSVPEFIRSVSYWTSTPSDTDSIWGIDRDGYFFTGDTTEDSDDYYFLGIRPVIKVSKETISYAESLAEIKYTIGQEITIGDEKFNVISDNGTTVSMLAQYNISDSTTYKQTDEQWWTMFSDNDGWEYTPGPKEIDVQTWGGDSKRILNNYVSYLKSQYNVDVTGDLITMTQLGELGCTIPAAYVWGDAEHGDYTCTNSDHSEWLVNGQLWWTRSADSEYSNRIWFMGDVGYLGSDYYSYGHGVRPVIIISKYLLN